MVQIFGYLALMLGLTLSNFIGANVKAHDAERAADINAIHAQLEMHYAEFGYYPEDLTNLIGVDKDALNDPGGIKINADGSDYRYDADGCDQDQCESYSLYATLSNGEYRKNSLN